MRDCYLLRLSGYNLHARRQVWPILLALALFGSIGMSSALEIKTVIQDANVWHAVLLGFAGPSVSGGSMLSALKWLVPHVLFFFLVGRIANEELLHRGYAIVPLIGSRRTWWLGKVSILLLLSAGYTLLWFLGVFLGAAFALPLTWTIHPFVHSGNLWPFPFGVSVLDMLIWIFGLYVSTLFALSLIQIALSVWWRHSFHAFVVIVVVAISSWLFGTEQPELVRWLPGSQSILSRHIFLDVTVPAFTFEWSLLYNSIVIVITISLIIWNIKQLDIFGNQLSEIR